MTGVRAYDGRTAWLSMPFRGSGEPRVIQSERAAALREDADIDGPLIGCQQEGHQLELVGREEVDGTPAYKLKVKLESGDVLYYYLDSEYYVPIKIEGRRTIRGNEREFETILSDYKPVDGLLIPHAIETKAKGAPGGQVMTIEKVELNVEVDDSIFSMPARPPAGGR